MIKKLIIAVILLHASGFRLQAEEGMWIPMLIEKLNIKQMQELGLKLSAEDIYSINHSSLKDAIVQFGGGCTAEIVSQEGLILTNHHCGLGSIQRLSSMEHDYLAKGFWAQSKSDEIPSPGTTVTLLVRMEDVTTQVLNGVTDNMTQFARSQVVKANIEKLEKEASQGNRFEAKVKSFYYGNQYYLFVNEVFRDVRLVGTPPSTIGQFGGDTDNWMWPRHGGDFSIFRIYADKNNNPSNYSKENVPYKPKKYLKISLKGYKEGDFTFIFGYPGSTREHLTSYGVDLTANKENPVRIEVRQKRLDIINEAMNQSKLVRIQYTAKHQGIANGWKKMMGESRGIKRLNAVEAKKKYEKRFQSWADSLDKFPKSAGMKKPVSFSGLLPSFEQTYQALLPADIVLTYLSEAGLGIECVRFAGGCRELVKICKTKNHKQEDVDKLVEKLRSSAKGFFKDYNASTDEKVAVSMLELLNKSLDPSYKPAFLKQLYLIPNLQLQSHVSKIFASSYFTDSTRFYSFLEKFKPSQAKKLEKDPVFQFSSEIYAMLEDKINPEVLRYNQKIDSLQRIYMAAQMMMQHDKRFYPDANSTLRVAYGKVADYYPADAVRYNYFTTSKGILQKEDTTIYDYSVDPKLKKLFLDKDFGRYADRDGTLHVAFTASNHTTGGNSGSPVLDANGNLLGLNFDRNWEGTMSDLMYDPDQCRNITLDIRYCLFIIDKFASSQRLVEEMEIVN